MTTLPVPQEDIFVHPENFVDGLRKLAAERPEGVALTVVAGTGDQVAETTLTYRAFEQRVLALASVLQDRFEQRDRILILLDNDEHYAVSMFACFHAGVIAVPAFPPESARPQHLARLVGIAEDAQARGVLTSGQLRILMGVAVGQFGVSEVVAVDEVDSAAAADWQPYQPDSADVAFLQYTSGSTSAPKGVMVTHGNLMANERAIREGLSIGPDDKFGVWSPLFHDMGLIGGLLQPFYSGIPCVLSSPRFFLERPVRWLEMISRHRITISGGPDFAYRLCLDRIKEVRSGGLDLSSWRVAYAGAEPVRHDTMEAFVDRFAPVGFSAGAVYPCYGLAEATLFVTGGRRGSGMTVNRFDSDALSRLNAVPASDGKSLVGCGRVPGAHEIRLVDPQTGVLSATGEIGEIWAAGPSIAAGYWKRPRETAEAFVECDGYRWLRTGDLGFVQDGHLFVAGRLKDMIIVRGHNLYPQDIERAVEAEVEAVRKGRVAVFAVDRDGLEGIGIAAEVSRGLQKLIAPQVLADALGAVASEQCDEAPQVIVLLNPGALPKTSSGKLQRSACSKGWMEGTLDAYAVFEGGLAIAGLGGGEDRPGAGATPLDELAQALTSIWREVLKHDATQLYGGDGHFFALGGNSLAAVQVAALIARQWEIDFSPRLVFEHPRLQAQVEAIRRNQKKGVRTSASAITALTAEHRARPLPLSSAQRRQWFLWQLDTQSITYHVQGALRIIGQINAEAMRGAVEGLTLRHESLRTLFRARSDGEVEQIVHPAGPVDFQLVDLRDTADDEREVRAVEALRTLNAQPFDLTRGPLMRAALVRLADETHVLALVMHHIISDGASMQILVDELAVLYAAGLAGDGAGLPLPLPELQYTDYAAWEHDHPDKEAHERQLSYWRKQLEVAPGEEQPVLTLPADHVRQPMARYLAAHHRFELPAALLSRLRQLAESQGTTLFAVLLAAFHALLHRHTGQPDIRVGVPVANRGRPELRRVVGFFVNTLVLRTQIDGRTSLAQVLAQVREVALGAQENLDVPFERLVEALQPERSLSHSPLFQVVFNHLQADPGAFARQTGLAVEEQPLPDQEVQFELTLDTREHPDGRVSANFTYARDLFESSRIERFAFHYVALLRALEEQPEQSLGEVAILNDEERVQIERWSRNPQRYPDTEPVHRLIERQAALRPAATALILREETLSYSDLDKRANRLAHRLIAQGVIAEQRVGLALDRSVDMIVALLAILKAGGVFVPLDPHYPADRLASMAEDSQTRVVLTQSRVRERLRFGQALHVMALDELDLDLEPDHAPTIALHGENLAYVIYTSGSTGKPKGVAVAHRALVEHAQLSAAFSSLSPQDRMLQFATLNFDGFIEQLFPPLLLGATVVLRGAALWNPEEFLHELREHQISIVDLPTAYWFALIRSFANGGDQDYGSLREVHIGGEAMPAEAVPVWRQAGLGGVKLLNTYGPTEAVVVASVLDCASYTDGERPLPVHMPIGRPLPGRSLRVLDTDLHPVPVGVAGELFIGGPLLARGYLDRAGISAERFVADPFESEGTRLYRTGDRVRWNPDGNLEYLGRVDHQVKIRGFRVELGEIEAQLLAQSEVREAVVVEKDVRLAAYVSLSSGRTLDARELRTRLARVLPDYMVPSVIVPLGSLPLNPNGKVDRRALPDPERPDQQVFEAPQGEVEAALAQLWTEVLGVQNVGRSDNFFELGGHSLMAVQMAASLASRYACEVPVRLFFEAPTLYEFALRLSEECMPGAGSRKDRLAQMHNLMSELEV
ncbi:amino acid adenylation domain-containing protein [Achromobacter sp. SD115]|uniref:non-ribosomal peptide synthetase n=1 Tax=Achromobacter sp. SD115 TaxID=2782011 RepID=UPI001A96C974|nr:non-ribosomal peptide synthetase [Achromobacter sp. SD115]MBO1013729.1 amino acid adenylation domain-containing protein [Achromobacter sp. SD115]